MKKTLCLIICLILALLPVFSGCGASAGTDAKTDVSVSEATDEPDGQEDTGNTEVSINYPQPLPHEGAVQTPEEEITEGPEESETPEPTEEPEEGPPATEADIGTPDTFHDPLIESIRSETEALLENCGGEWSVYFERVDTGGSFTINNRSMVSASLIKLFVYGTVMEQIENGELFEEDWHGYLWDMIVWSDNDSCNILIDAAGGFDAVNDFIARHGFHATELNRKMLDWNGLENYTSASDCGHLLREALQGTFVSEYASALLLEMMRQQSVTWKIPAGVPEGVITGNKTGELTNVENDAAFIESPACTYILCVMTAGVDSGTAIADINELSSAVYSLLNDETEGEET